MEWNTPVKFSNEFTYRPPKDDEAIVVRDEFYWRYVTFSTDEESDLQELDKAVQDCVDMMMVFPRYVSTYDGMLRPLILFQNLDRVERLLSQSRPEDLPEEAVFTSGSSGKRKKGKERVGAVKKMKPIESVAYRIKIIKSLVMKKTIKMYSGINECLALSPPNFIIKCKETTFPVHKQIIARCPDLISTFYSIESGECDLTGETEPAIVKQLIQHLYGEPLIMSHDDKTALEEYRLLYQLAERLDLKKLMSHCGLQIIRLDCKHYIKVDCRGLFGKSYQDLLGKFPQLPHNREIHSETIVLGDMTMEVNPLVLESHSFFLLKILRDKEMRMTYFPNVPLQFFKLWSDSLHLGTSPSQSKEMRELLSEENAYELYGLLKVEGLFKDMWESLEVEIFKKISSSKTEVDLPEPFFPFTPKSYLEVSFSKEELVNTLKTLNQSKLKLKVSALLCQSMLRKLLVHGIGDGKKYHNVTSLSLSNLSFNDEEIRGMFHVFPNIRKLSFENVNCKKIKSMEGVNPKLKKFKLITCSNLNGMVLWNLFVRCKHLFKIKLMHCNEVTDDLIQVLALKYRLMNLSVSYCEKVTDTSIDLLVEKGRYLKCLDVRGCPKVTDTSILKFANFDCRFLVADSGVKYDYSQHPQLKGKVVR